MIDHGSIVEVLEEEGKTPWTDTVYWDEIISGFETDWNRRFRDCRVRYRERCGACGWSSDTTPTARSTARYTV